jgi:hypothetical protein
MVTMRDAANPFALKWALSRTDTDEQDVVVLTVRMMGAGGPEKYLGPEDQIFSEHEQMVFTKAISVAESFGKKVSLARRPAGDIFAALMQTAVSLEVDSVVSGLSTKMSARGAGLPHRPGLGNPSRTQASAQLLRHQPLRRIQGLLSRTPRAHPSAPTTSSSSIASG